MIAEEKPWKKKRNMREMRVEKNATVSISDGVGSMVESKMMGAGNDSE